MLEPRTFDLHAFRTPGWTDAAPKLANAASEQAEMTRRRRSNGEGGIQDGLGCGVMEVNNRRILDDAGIGRHSDGAGPAGKGLRYHVSSDALHSSALIRSAKYFLSDDSHQYRCTLPIPTPAGRAQPGSAIVYPVLANAPVACWNAESRALSLQRLELCLLDPWRVSTPMGPSAVDVGTVGLGVVSELSPVVGYTV